MDSFCVEDLYRHSSIAAMHGRSASERVVFTLTKPDRKKDSYRTSLWIHDESGARKIVPARWKATSPCLSPDAGQVAFVSRRAKDTAEIRLLEVGGGASRRVGEPSTTLQSISDWSQSNRLLTLHKVARKEDALDDVDAGSSRPHVMIYVPYKIDGNGFTVGYRTECRVFDLDSAEDFTLVGGDFDVRQALWSPDGSRVAYIRTREGQQRHRTDIWIVGSDGGKPRQLTKEFASVSAFAWSPDGKRLALCASTIEGDSISECWVVDAESGAAQRASAQELQCETGDPLWHEDNRRLAFTVSRLGRQEIVIVDIDESKDRPVERGLSQVTTACAAGGSIVFVASTVRKAAEIYRMDWDGGNERRLTRFNRHWFVERPRPHVRKRRFSVPDGDGGVERVDAWLLTPPDRDPPYPVLVDMHGGPQSAALLDYADHVYWYELLARGWMIVAPNAVGSGGYGFDFARRLRGRWGELDLPQYEAILSRLRQTGLAGPVAVCTGKSYGGFLSAWALGHSDAFSRVVISAPVANLESHVGTSDTGYYVSPYAVGAELSVARRLYRAMSPIESCSESRVPALLLQGGDDQRCPLGQAEEIFTHLMRCGKPAKMVVYPGGSHSMAGTGRPSHRVDYHRRIVEWAEQARQEAGSDARDERRQPVEAAEL
jgi:dipeptidyl aminopeptidase/acylaminoacyl peptidase